MFNCTKKVISILGYFLCLSLFPLSLFANDQNKKWYPESFSYDFKYQDKPIDPMCVGKMVIGDSSRFDSINLAACSNHLDYKISKVNSDLIARGYAGYHYIRNDSNNSGYSEQGHNYYKYLGAYKDFTILYAISNGGGSGLFSSILAVRQDKEKDAIQLAEQIAVGDRCNGGIRENVILRNEKIVYEVHITPYDILALGYGETDTVQAYDDLAACATCCAGVAKFEYNLVQLEESKNTQNLKASDASSSDESMSGKLASGHTELVSLTLNSPENQVVQGKYQSCFNSVVSEYRKQNKMILSPNELNEFGQKFLTSCIKN